MVVWQKHVCKNLDEAIGLKTYETEIFEKYIYQLSSIGILLPKLFWPTVRKICSSDREKL